MSPRPSADPGPVKESIEVPTGGPPEDTIPHTQVLTADPEDLLRDLEGNDEVPMPDEAPDQVTPSGMTFDEAKELLGSDMVAQALAAVRKEEVTEQALGPVKTSTPPQVKVKKKGKISRRMDMLVELYLKEHPGEAVRWCYHPEHKPDLSNLLDRQMDGYRLVFVKELGSAFEASLPDMKPDDPVRTGDVVLMSIGADVQAGFRKELDDEAQSELQRVHTDFYHAVDDEANKGVRTEHRLKARGRSTTVVVDKVIDVDESLREK